MRTLIHILLIIGTFVIFERCTPESHDTIIFLGDENCVIPMEKMVPDSLNADFQSFMDSFGDNPEGYYPPDIEGEYHIGKKQFLTSNLGYDLSDTMDMYLRVVNQQNRLACVEFYEGSTVWTDTAFVMGNGQQFSLYFVEYRELLSYGIHHAHKRFVIFKGKKTDEGVLDMHFGCMILTKGENGDPLVGAFVPGWYFIYKDADGLSENTDWFDQHDEEEDDNE